MIDRTGRGALAIVALAATLLALPASAQDQAAPAPQGTISGVVLDKGSGQPIIEAGVEVVGTGKKTVTDLDGRYSIRVPVGVYEVRFYAPLYQGARIQKVAVTADEVRKLDVSLLSSGQAGVDVVEVTAQANRAAEATQLLQRKKAPVVSDNISAESIRKTPGSAASDVVRRAPAVTVRNERFVFVRGLSERYTSANLNGSRLPSTDPQRRVIPLDLFPADFLQSLSVLKSYSPDLPGDFSGGLLDLQLREFPDQLTGSIGASVGANTQATFNDFDTYRGSSTDALTYGSSFRDIPEGFPDRFPVGQPLPDRFARRFRNVWAGEHGPGDVDNAPPNYGANASVGNSWGPFGIQLGASFRNEWKSIQERQRQFINNGTIDDPIIAERDDFTYDRSIFESRLGSVLTTAWKPTLEHNLSFRALWNRNAQDEVRDGTGEAFGFSTPGEDYDTTSARWTEEELAFGQFAGEHRLRPWLRIDWRTAFSRTTQDEPDTRFLTYTGPRGDENWIEDSLGGLRLFNSLEEILTDSQLDFTIPFRTGLPFTDVWNGLQAKFKFGPAYAFRDRDFSQRRFQNSIDPTLLDSTLPAEDLLDPMNFGPGENEIAETTQKRDQFSATHEIVAGYGMFDLPIVRDRLRFVGGVRLEYSYIELVTFDISENKVLVRKNTLDALPGANLIYSPRDDMNIRGSWSRTVSRPEFRELSPTQFPAPRGLRPLFGNPLLEQSEIESWDLRWEWFFSPLELVSLSFFYKQIDKPIEQVIVVVGAVGVDSFANAEEAELIGGELEFRKDFGFLSRHLRDLSLLTNFTYADSTVTTPRGSLEVQTSTERQLQGQPAFVANAVLDYTKPDWVTARVLYSTADDVLTNAGSFGLPDIFEQRRDSLDAVLSFPLRRALGQPLTLRLSAENLLNAPYVSVQGDELQRRYATGVKFTIGLSYAFSGGITPTSPPSSGTAEGTGGAH